MAQLLNHVQRGDVITADMWNLAVDAINELLIPDRLGCQIGGGTGLVYSYVELALTDVDAALRRIRQRLRAGRMPIRTWVLFHDSDLCGEWVGIYDDAPPPPGFE